MSDMKHFTSNTRTYGIAHVASVIVRMRQIVYPILHRYRAVHVTTEADNMIAVFQTAHDAVRAALTFKHAVARYNNAYTETYGATNHQIQLNGVGISFGERIKVDVDGKLYGDVASTAYHIGEDVCKNEDVLVCAAARSKLPATVKTVDNKDGHFKVVRGDADVEMQLPYLDDASHIGENLVPIAGRKKGYGLCMKAVLMFDVDYGVKVSKIKKYIVEEIKKVVHYHGGNVMEDTLHTFDSVTDALWAAIVLRANSLVPTVGFGIHIGSMLIVPGTDIHWGDPVNTASKLGQDAAARGDILITRAAHELVYMRDEFQGHCFKPLNFVLSGIEFHVMRLSQPQSE